jgi:cyanophycinase
MGRWSAAGITRADNAPHSLAAPCHPSSPGKMLTMTTDAPTLARRAWFTRSARTALATLCLALAPWATQAQSTLAQFWEFDDPAGTSLPNAAPGFEGGATWSPALAGVATTGSGALRLGWNSTSFGDSFAPLNIGEAGVASFTVRVDGWSIANGANSGTGRPFWSLGLRSAAAVSGSVVAEVEFTALGGGVDVLVRDAQSSFTAQRFQLPSVLPGPLTLSLTVDKTTTPRSWRLDYAVENGNSGSVGGTLGNTSAGRNISHLMLSVRGNHPNSGNNSPAAIDRIEASWEEAPVSFDPPVAGRPPKPSNLVTFVSGTLVQSTNPPVGGPGLLLMGGGAEVDAAFTQRAYPINNGGDIVVLRVSGGSGYQNYLYTELVQQLPPALRATLQPNSVMTLIVDTRSKANSDYVFDAISKANLVWMAGGDQSQYISNWRGTRLAEAVNLAYQRGAVIGGTSAGMVTSGQWMYDPGPQTAVISSEAVANPYRPSVILSTDLFDLPLGRNLVPEPHFANRDRMGRLLTFMARLRQDERADRVIGVGLDEQTSMFIDADGIGTFQRQASAGNAYVLREDSRRTRRVQVAPNQPLIYRDLLRSRLATAGQTFDFGRGVPGPGVPTTVISVEGTPPSGAYSAPAAADLIGERDPRALGSATR